jgi:phosphoserine aminotransferase
MNVSFNIRDKNAELEAELIKRTEENGMIGLKGHRSIGGLRASIYNAVSMDAVKALVELMEKFAAEKQ